MKGADESAAEIRIICCLSIVYVGKEKLMVVRGKIGSWQRKLLAGGQWNRAKDAEDQPKSKGPSAFDYISTFSDQAISFNRRSSSPFIVDRMSGYQGGGAYSGGIPRAQPAVMEYICAGA